MKIEIYGKCNCPSSMSSLYIYFLNSKCLRKVTTLYMALFYDVVNQNVTHDMMHVGLTYKYTTTYIPQ